MNLNTALKNIKKMKPKFAKEEILIIRKNKEEAIPVLLEYLENIINNLQNLSDLGGYDDYEYEDFNDYFVDSMDVKDPFYTIYLLGEFRVHSAFKPLLEILKFDYKLVDWLLGDMLLSDYGPVIASVSDSIDIAEIKSLLENKSLHWYHIGALLSTLATLYVEGVYKREEFIEFLGYLLDYYKDDYELLGNVVYICYKVKAKEHFEKIIKYFDEGLIEELLTSKDDFEERILENDNEEKILMGLKKDDGHLTFITDTIKSMEWWAYFKKESANNVKKQKLKKKQKSKKKIKSWKK